MLIAELDALIRDRDVSLTDDYLMFGRSFDGIDHRFTSIIKQEHPEDYAKILQWFPLVELELLRYEITT